VSINKFMFRFLKLSILLMLLQIEVTAAECSLDRKDPGSAEGRIAIFDKQALAMSNSAEIDPFVRSTLCPRENLYHYLLEDPGYSYVGCFTSQQTVESFWNSNHDAAEELLQRMNGDCVKWARQRYQSIVAGMEENTRRRVAEKTALKQAVNKARAEAEKKALMLTQKKASTRAKARAQQRLAALEAAIDAAGVPITSRVVWKTTAQNPPSGMKLDREIASYLFSWEIEEALAAGKNSQQALTDTVQEKLTSIFGIPRVAGVAYEKKKGAYRIHLVASDTDYSVDASLRADPGMEQTLAEMTPHLVFSWGDSGLAPQSLVLQADDQTLHADITSTSLIERVPVELSTMRYQADASEGIPYELSISCKKHGSGAMKSVRQCLKKDGVIAILKQGTPTRVGYPDLPANQKEYRVAIDAPFRVFVRSGGHNSMGILSLGIQSGSDNGAEGYTREALGAGKVIFVAAP